jgi:hypothetical protein
MMAKLKFLAPLVMAGAAATAIAARRLQQQSHCRGDGRIDHRSPESRR